MIKRSHENEGTDPIWHQRFSGLIVAPVWSCLTHTDSGYFQFWKRKYVKLACKNTILQLQNFENTKLANYQKSKQTHGLPSITGFDWLISCIILPIKQSIGKCWIINQSSNIFLGVTSNYWLFVYFTNFVLPRFCNWRIVFLHANLTYFRFHNWK